MKDEVRIEYCKMLAYISGKYSGMFNRLSHLISELDVYKSSAKCAYINKYTRPILNKEDRGCFNAVKLRHPIIESLNKRSLSPYIPHDISLSSNGIILYGVNSTGKSSAMKSVGCNIACAQAGFFVPAESFSFSPYRSILTRILSNDNIFKGLSSYIVEMNELRSIIQRSDKYTLVLGDEVCHGTDTDSAVSLVAASIMHLCHVECSFIFATHLHQLTTLSEIQNLVIAEKLSLKHLSVAYDEQTDHFIYDRLLKDGSGESTYGIEVAAAVRIQREVIVNAMNIRNKYFNTNYSIPKPSLYNRDLILDRCNIPGCNKVAVDTHHIIYRSESSISDNLIDIDHRSNLVALCKDHHNDVHCPKGDKELIIFGYIDGILKYKYRKNLHWT